MYFLKLSGSYQPTTISQSEEEWTEVTDDQSGQIYYYNTLTGATSWDNPLQSLQSLPPTSSSAATPPPDAQNTVRNLLFLSFLS